MEPSPTPLNLMPGLQPTFTYTVVKEWALPISLLAIGLGLGYYLGKKK